MTGRARVENDRRDVARERDVSVRALRSTIDGHSARVQHGDKVRWTSHFERSDKNAADRPRLRDRHRLAGDDRVERAFEIANRRLRAILAELDVAIVDAAAIHHLRSAVITATSGVTVTPVCFDQLVLRRRARHSTA